MKRNKLFLLALAIPTVLAFVRPGDEVRFRPTEGHSSSKTFSTTVELSLDEMRVVMNGEEQDSSAMGLEMSMSNKTDYAWTDTYGRVKDGRAEHLKRKFTSLTNVTSTVQSNQFTGSQDFDIASASELDGKTVLFDWDAEAEAFVASFPEDDDSNVELLTGLDEDSDLRGLLPTTAVAEGDKWSVDSAFLSRLMAPGGNLKMVPNEKDLPEGMGQTPGADLSFSDMLGDVEGDIQCEFMGSSEEEGRRLAKIKVSIDISSANDLTEMIKAKMDELDLGDQGMKMDFQSADVELAIEGEGALLFDLAAGHFVSFEFSGNMGQTMDMAMAMATPMGDMDIEQSIIMSGSIAFAFEVTED